MDLLSNGGSFNEGVSVSEPVVHWVEVWIDWSGWVLNLLSDGRTIDEGVSISEPVVHWVEVWINRSRWILNLSNLCVSTSGSWSTKSWVKNVNWDQWLGLGNRGSFNESVSVSEPIVHWIEVWIDWC